MAESGRMASFSNVEALPETEKIVVDQQASKACDAEGACLAAATVETEENEEATLQKEQPDKAALVPDHHQDVSAPEEHADAEAPPAPEEHAAEPPAAPPAPEEHAAADAPAPAEEEHGDHKKDQQAVAAKEEVEEPEAASATATAAGDQAQAAEESTRERLKRHRREMAGRVWVPEMWGQEKLLKDWVDCAVFDRPMVPTAGLLTARRALIAECCTTTRRPDRRTSSPSSSTTSSSPPLRVPNGCS